MRKEKTLIAILRGIADLLLEESMRNPKFANRLEEILVEVSNRRVAPKRASVAFPNEQLPDIYSEWGNKGETEFRLWLRDQPIAVLRQIIQQQDYDPTRKTTKWKETEKLSDFISDSLRARLSRGSSFIGKTDKRGLPPTGE